MRPERLYLLDILEAAGSIARFVAKTDQAAFRTEELIQSAVLQKLTTIGEAASHLSREFRDRHPDVPWRDIVAFRNIAVHAYFALDLSLVWTAATEDAPELRERVKGILDSEFE